jgi:outer membrane receptor protein involved in Fe transport
VVSGSWSRNDGVKSSARPGTRVDNEADCAITGDPADCNTIYAPNYSSYSAYGRIFIPSTGASYVVSNGTGPTGTVSSWSTAKYGFNRNSSRWLETPVDRLVFSANGHYDVTDSLQFYMQTTFANTKSSAAIEPDPNDDTTYPQYYDYAGDTGIPISNPYVPATIYNAAVAAGDNYLSYRRRMVELGPRQYNSSRDLYRIVTGLKGTIFNQFNWDAYFDWGHTIDTLNGTGNVNLQNMREALNAQVATAADIAGGALVGGGPAKLGDVICTDVWAQALGCVPINIFGLNSISAAAAKYVGATTSRIQNVDEQVIGGSIEGPVYTLPAGDLHVVGGFEYRREYASDVPDELQQKGLTDTNTAEPTYGGYHVLEFFAETEVPIIKDVDFVKELSFGGAVRWSQYGTSGATTVTNAYSGRTAWSPIDGIRFRGQFAHAVRAPNIGELYSPGGQDFASVSDPCNGVTATSTGSIAQRCLTDPSIAARVAATGSFTLTQTELQGTGGISGEGNKNLTPEKADTWSVGGVFDHDFGSAGSVIFSVDWFHINIGNVITTVGRQDALDQCYGSGSYPNSFCGMFVRKSTGAAYQLGAITAVNSGYGNQGSLKTSGIDFSVSYQVDLNEVDVLSHGNAIGLDNAGQIALRTNWTWTQALNTTSFGTTTYSNNTVEDPMHKVQLALVYTNGPLTLQWETDFQSSTTATRIPTSLFYTVEQRAYFLDDLTFTYQITKEFELFGGINNIWDVAAPPVLSYVPGNTTGSNTDENAYDAIGRRFFLGGRVKL